MTIKELIHLKGSLVDLFDFAQAGCDGDESGIYKNMRTHYRKSIKIIDDSIYKLHLKNELAKLKRKAKE